jgi:RHS repeat-associated protein
VVPTAGGASPKAYAEYTDGTSSGTPVLAGGGVPLAAQGNALGTDGLGGGSALEACQCGGQGSNQGAADPVNAATGDNYSTAVDLTVPGAGVPLAFTRTYDAQAAQNELIAAASPGPLGYGWTYNLGESVSYNSSSQVATVTEGNGAQDVFNAYSSSTSPAWCSSSTNFCAASPRTIATLNQNTDGSWTLVNNVSSRMTDGFNSSGVLTQVTNAQGDSLILSSGTPGSGQCPSASISCSVWTSSASGRALTLAFNSSGQLTQVADPANNVATFCFYTQSCASGAPSGGGQSTDLYTATDPGSLTTAFTYDAANSNGSLQRDLLTVSPPGAGEVQNTYNTTGQVTQQQIGVAGAQVTTFSFSGNAPTLNGGTTTMTTYPQGTSGPYQVDTYTYSSGVMLSDTTTNSASSSQTTEIVARDPVSLLPTDVEDPNQNIKAQSLDSYDVNGSHSTSTNGNVTVSSDAMGNTTQSAYNSFNQAWCMVDAADFANLVKCPSSPPSAPPAPGASDPDLGMTISYYDGADQLTAKTDPLGNTTTYTYTAGVSGIPNGLMYCSVDPVSYQAGTGCPTYAGTHVAGTTTHTFDSAGDALTSTGADGSTTTSAYSVAGHPGLVSSTTDPDGTMTTYAYDAAGHVTSQVVTFGSFSATTAYAYDSSGRKYCQVDPYESAQGVTCPTSPPSPSSPPAALTSTFYDGNGRVIQTTNPIGGTTVTAYDDAGNKYCTVEPSAYAGGTTCPSSPPTTGTAGATIDVYNALEQLIEEISPIGGITLYSYDGAGNKVQQVIESNDSAHDPNVTTTYGYDADNRVTNTTVDPGSSLAATTLQTYDPNGNVYCSASANAFSAGSSAYQCPPWQPSWIANPPSPLNLFSSSPNATQANNVTVKFSNANGNEIESTDPNVHTTITAVDGDGRTYCRADATNVATWLAAHSSSLYPYLCPGTPPSTAPTGTTTGYTTTIFDAAGRTLSSTDQVGDTTTYTYDPVGHKLTTVDPRGNTTTSCYYWENATGQCAQSAPTGGGSGDDLYSQTTPATSADPSGETTTTTYYAGDNSNVTTTPAGSATNAYDANGNLTSTTYSGTASGYSTPPNVSNTYNVDGTKATMTDGTGTTTYSYDLAGNVTQQALVVGAGTGLSNKATFYSYFSTGTLNTVTYPSYAGHSSPVVTYTYDGTGAMASETDWLSNTVTFAHDADGNRTLQDNAVSTSNPSGTSSTALSYDAADQNTQASSTLVQTCSGSTETLTQSFSGTGGSRNPNGQVTQDSESYAGSCSGQPSYQRNYSYDAAGRVVYQGATAQGSPPNTLPNTFAYDAAGDPSTISSHDSSGNFDTYTQTFDPAGEVVGQTPVSGSAGVSSSFTYDTLGDQTNNVSGSVTSTYGFNQSGQMTSFHLGTTTTTYTYTGDGLEASSKPSTATSPNQLIWDTNGSLATLLSDGTNDYIYGPSDTPVEQVNITPSPPTSNPQFMTYTASDSSWLMTNTSGDETAYYRYDAFGNLAFGTPGSPFGYAGQYQDTSSNSTGFSNMRARWYNPGTGSFTTRDPLFSTTDMAYTYALGDPVNNSDPNGTYPYCTLQVHNPHHSGHRLGSASVQATTDCHGNWATKSWMSIQLYKTSWGFLPPYFQNQRSDTKYHVVKWSISTGVGCTGSSQSTFFGVGEGLITHGDGSKWVAIVQGPSKSLPCSD